ncbi:MAG: hypothetical protein ACLU4J_01895 [Butyricimonas paravirosa]
MRLGKKGHSGRIRIVRWVAVVAAVWVLALGVTLWMTLGRKKMSLHFRLPRRLFRWEKKLH